ncbi:tubulin-specific chaperone c [Lindgomyces ingoldianus]|uniref:Tubulin-specific chaperone c n=1 Tax=Lindgomyces ingoldianus TaxID=673940 RepID=A0ACB6QIP5_9PLEO|nr:tubulin-specific chaperone c [Lindgomyces ingoldianus]KAF2466742.1 tubulin-specific chaperone c [Lindgomyces ingoldianus]
MATSTGAPQPPSEASLKERFFRYFQHEVTDLQEQMERLNKTAYAGGERNDAVDHCLAGIERLSHEVKDASSYIPAYDQRTYGEAIKALSEKLQNIRNSFAPPKKFQFKTARKNPSAISLSDVAELAQQTKLGVLGYQSDTSNANSSFAPTPLDKMSPSEEKLEPELCAGENPQGIKEDKVSGIRKPSFSNANSVTISNHSGVHIILPTSASHATSSGTVSNLRRCVVDLSPPTSNGGAFAGLALKNIKDSLIVCGHVAGPIHITSVENSVIVTACRQFRMHASRNTDVYLHCSSRPIIEDCEEIRFAPLPEKYNSPDISVSQNQWDQIDDFKWLKSEPSPHFSLLPASDHIKEEVWKDIVPGGHSVSLDDVLRALAILH